MHDDVSSHLVSLFFTYLPTPAHCRRDRVRASLEEIFSRIARLCRSTPGRGHDMLRGLLYSRYRDGRGTTEAEVTGLLLALHFAGHHTCSATQSGCTRPRRSRGGCC